MPTPSTKQQDLDGLLAEFTDMMNADASAEVLDVFLKQHSEDSELHELAEVVRRLSAEFYVQKKISKAL